MTGNIRLADGVEEQAHPGAVLQYAVAVRAAPPDVSPLEKRRAVVPSQIPGVAEIPLQHTWPRHNHLPVHLYKKPSPDGQC